MPPHATTRFATSDGLSIAYQVVGDGPVDLVFVPGFVSHVELNWEYIFTSAFLERLLPFCRLVILDKRGSGLSDRTLGAGTLEGRMDDIRAVMDAAGPGAGRAAGRLQRGADRVDVRRDVPRSGVLAGAVHRRLPWRPAAAAGLRGRRCALVQEYWTTGLVLNTIVHHAPGPGRGGQAARPGSSATPAPPPSRWRSSAAAASPTSGRSSP